MIRETDGERRDQRDDANQRGKDEGKSEDVEDNEQPRRASRRPPDRSGQATPAHPAGHGRLARGGRTRGRHALAAGAARRADGAGVQRRRQQQFTRGATLHRTVLLRGRQHRWWADVVPVRRVPELLVDLVVVHPATHPRVHVPRQQHQSRRVGQHPDPHRHQRQRRRPQRRQLRPRRDDLPVAHGRRHLPPRPGRLPLRFAGHGQHHDQLESAGAAGHHGRQRDGGRPVGLGVVDRTLRQLRRHHPVPRLLQRWRQRLRDGLWSTPRH